MKKRIISVILNFLFFILNPFCFSQNSKTDSLLTVLKTAKEDTTKVKILNNLFLQYEFTDDEKAKEYLNKALELSQKIDYKKGLATTYINLGYFAEDKGDYQQAIIHYRASLKISEKLSDKKGIAASNNNIGIINYNQGNYPEALKSYFASLKIDEATGNKAGIASSYNNIGLVYEHQGNYPEALKNFRASLKIKEVLDDKKGIASSYNNIGIIYDDQDNYPEALKNFLISLKIYDALDDKTGIVSSYNNIGGIYYSQGNYPEALKNHFASLKIEEAMGDKADLARSYINIGGIFTKQKKYKEAEEYLIKAKELSEKIGYIEFLRETYSALTELDSAKGNYRGAFENHKLYILYRDSLDNEETRKKTIQSQMTFDFEKKEAVASAEHKIELENQIALAEEKSRKQKAVLILVSGVLLLVFVFAGFIFRSLRVTRKQKHIIELQKARVEEQKLEVEHQKLLVEEHQKEIIDSITYAKRLQQAILPSNEEIKKYLPNSFILYKPKDIVAGDFYWMHVSPKEELVFIAAADSTGHGVPGAMVSVVCSNALNRAVNEFNLIDTGQLLDKTRELVLETFAKSGEEIMDGMDISLLAINKETKQISWSGANNPLWYFQNNNLIEIKPDKQSIGKTDNPEPFTTHNLKLNSGDTFFLMTDGYADQFGGSKGKKYKYKQLQEKIIVNNNLPLVQQKENLINFFDEWKGNLEQVDDVTIIGIRI